MTAKKLPRLSLLQRREIKSEIKAIIRQVMSEESDLCRRLEERQNAASLTLSALSRLIEAFEEKSEGISAQLDFLKSKVSVEEIRGLTIRMGQLEASLRTIQDYIKHTLAAFK